MTTVSSAGIPEDIRRLESSFVDSGQPGGISFDDWVHRVVAFQRDRIPVYDRYVRLLGEAAEQSPHLPIESFKSEVLCTFPPAEADTLFLSSGTTSATRSRHFVYRLRVYEKSILRAFEQQFGGGPFTLVAYLPGYKEAGSNSSLLYMVQLLVRSYGDEASGSFFGRLEALRRAIGWSRRYGSRFILFGTAFGLLDLLEKSSALLDPGSLVIETGGMKTRRREIGRTELHLRLAEGFGVPRENVISEYGMSEMLSQCYTRGGEVFHAPHWVRVEVRDPENPLKRVSPGEPGIIAVIDLANMYSISAILTEDLGLEEDGGFRVFGRLQGSELRGCNMLMDPLR